MRAALAMQRKCQLERQLQQFPTSLVLLSWESKTLRAIKQAMEYP